MTNSKQYYNKKWLILSNIHTEMTVSTASNNYCLGNSTRIK